MTPRIRAVGRALPKHYADQETLLEAFRGLWAKQHFNPERLEALHRAVAVQGRYLALPIDAYPSLKTFAEKNAAWTELAEDLGAQAIGDALQRTGLAVTDIDHLLFVTVTGLSVPSIDARLVNRLGFRPDVRRLPIFGLGCVAGAAGTARAADLLRGDPDGVALLLSVELCSLTLQRDDLSIPNMIASGLFGDGAAAVVMEGGTSGSSGPRVLASESVFYPNTERAMGWDVMEGGFRVVLSAKVPQLVLERIRGDVDSFLTRHALSRREIRHFVAHTGGPKVLRAFETALELAEGTLERSWRSLSEVGNLSSASVLFVLGDLLASEEAKPGDYGLMIAMGPGFCAELVLLQW